MKVSDVFKALASGELSNLNMGEGMDDIKEAKKEIVLRSINLGLEDLHNKFLLRKAKVEIPLIVGIQEYVIPNKDLIEILEVNHKQLCPSDLEPTSYSLGFGMCKGYSLTSLNTLVLDSKVTDAYSEYPLEVIYKARHIPLTEEDIELDSEIALPSTYFNALLYFIGSRLFASIPNQLDGDLQEGIRYSQRYVNEINELRNQGTDVEHLLDETQFYERGFV